MHSAWKRNWRIYISAIAAASLSLVIKYQVLPQTRDTRNDGIAYEFVQPRTFDIDVRAVGELEASKSIVVSSSIKGEQGKIIDIVKDGVHVNAGDFLVRLDATPFEEKIQELNSKVKEQEGCLQVCEQLLKAEESQVEHEIRIAEFELETAQLEWNKIVNGDCPMELSKLATALQKTRIKHEELEGYSNDLIALESKGYINSVELKQAQKKLREEKETFEAAKLQYESYVNHVQPMQIKKADSALKRAKLHLDEVIKNAGFKVGKTETTLMQSIQHYEELLKMLDSAQKELAMCEICAQAPGMVVLREEYRSSQKRKPRVGDNVLKNQPILDLPDLSSMIVKTKVREIDLYKIAIGKPTTIEVDAYPGMQFKGKVNWIGVLAIADASRASDEKYFEVKIELDNADQRLRPGMTARVNIHAAHVENQLTVPIHAVFDLHKNTHCYVKGLWGVSERQIEAGISNEHWIEVKSGLKSGEKVCLTTPDLIKN